MKSLLLQLLTLTGLCLPSVFFGKVTFEVQYMDQPGSGFFSTETRAPVGLNPGQTLGEQRRIALERTLQSFASRLTSSIPIHIEAGFVNLGGSTTSAVLASAGPEWFNFSFKNAPAPNIAYPSALANKISGSDLSNASQGIADISITINEDIDGTALGSSKFYYGLDKKNAFRDIDFSTVVSHELMHGLGFLSAIDPLTGHMFGCSYASCRTNDLSDIYSTFLARLVNNTPVALETMTQESRLEALTADGELIWTGAQTQMYTSDLYAGLANGYLKIYAPSPLELGSSLSHTDFRIKPAEIMQASYSGASDLTPVNLAMLGDLGWGQTTDLGLTVEGNTNDETDKSFNVRLSNNGAQSIPNILLNFEQSTGVLLLESQDENIRCEIKSERKVQCTLASLANQQIYDAGFTLQQEFVNGTIKVDIEAGIVDIRPANNVDIISFGSSDEQIETDTTNVIQATQGDASPNIAIAAPTRVEKGGSINMAALLFLLMLICSRARVCRQTLKSGGHGRYFIQQSTLFCRWLHCL